MKRTVRNTFNLRSNLVLVVCCLLSFGVAAQTVTIVPTGTAVKPNLIPTGKPVSFSINPIGFGSCMNNLSYAWAILGPTNDTVYKSTAASPNYSFALNGVYKIALTVKTVPGGSCTANITKTATSYIKVAGGGPTGVPKPNMFSANALGTMISAYAMDVNGTILSGPYDHFDPFPANNAVTAALAMDDKGNFFYLPTFMNGSNPLTASTIPAAGVVQVWAQDKNLNSAPVKIAQFDMNGASTAELGLFRMGMDKNNNAWILAGDGTNMYAAKFATNGTNLVTTAAITVYNVPFSNGSGADFQSGDLAFDNNGNMYVLAGSNSGVHIYTMPTNSATPTLTKKWKVTNSSGSSFGLSVTGTVFDADGNMYFSALDGIYFIDYGAVNPVTGAAVVTKVSDNFGLMDLATSQFPASWPPPSPAALPVKLMQFTGTARTGHAYLSWKVASNETGNYFSLERSEDGIRFRQQALIFTTNTWGEEAYSFADALPANGKAYYRLRMVNKDESVSYSQILTFDGSTKPALVLLQNPVTNAVRFNYTVTAKTVAEISVYAFSGVKLVSQRQSLQKGENYLSIALNGALPKGTYLLEVREGSAVQTIKFVKP